MQKVSNKKTIEEQYIQYLTDESRLVGDSINTLYFPESTDDVAAVVREVAERGESLTISGGRTGIVGGAVPQGSLNLISLEKLGSKIFIGYDGEWFARVAAGTLIEDLYTYLRNGVYAYLPGVFQAHDEQKLFYPVNPTETTAQVG